MALVDKATLLNKLSPPIDALLACQLLDEYISMEKRYILRDWGPAELDGGQFCEVLSRILYHIDSGNLNRSKSVEDCFKYIENDQVKHTFQPRQDALHIVRVMKAIYKFRSQRGAVHISPTYEPNNMDARFMLEAVRWSMMEVLRIFGQGDREAIAKIIREILQFDVPSIFNCDGQILVQRTDLTAEQEIMILLHYAGESGLSRQELGLHAQVSSPSISNAIKRLTSPQVREVIRLKNGNYRLTDLGNRRVMLRLADKLLLPKYD